MTDVEHNDETSKDNLKTQVYAAITASLGGFVFGNCLSYTSPALPSMKESDIFSNLTLEETSWFAALAMVGALIAGPCMGLSIEQLGRKGSMLLLTLPVLLGWSLIGLADNLLMLFAGRFLTGFAAGAYSLVTPIFINEIASESVRGRLGLINSVGVHSGICYPYVAGAFLTYDLLALTCCFIPIINFFMLLVVHESPRYLLTKGNVKKATLSLAWYRGIDEVEEELKLMRKSIESSREEQISLKDLFTTAAILKPTGICAGLFFFQITCGIDAIIFFNYSIFKSSGANISPNLSSISVGTVEVAAILLTSCIIDRFGRRPLLLLSEILMTISLTSIGLFFYLSRHDKTVRETLGWLPLLSLIVYCIGFSLGMGPIPFIYMEILPSRVIGIVSSFLICFAWTGGLVLTKFFEGLMEAIGAEWCFWIFALCSAVGTIFAYCCVPETKGKTLEEIQQRFK